MNTAIIDVVKHHAIEKDKVSQLRALRGNTWKMLKDTRFAPHFTFIGDFSRHRHDDSVYDNG